MKIVATISGLLMVLLFLIASVVVLFKVMPEPQITGGVKVFME